MNNKTKGQVLTEAIIAIGIITAGVLGMMAFLGRAINEGRYIADQITAINLAAEGIEIARNILDGNAVSGAGSWNQGFNQEGLFEVDYKSQTLGSVVSGTGALRTLNKEKRSGVDFYTYSNGERTPFKRSVRIEYVGGRSWQIRATATVYWPTSSKRKGEVSVSSDFYYWR
jgi:sugar (pentulose or hexulose) kinase